jgi:hypothetical protein
VTDQHVAEAPAWANGVTLKRTRDGYTWSVAVAADAHDLAALRAAVETARQIDAELTAAYGPPHETSAQRRVRIHAPTHDDADDASAGRSTR